jgi:hypothetical protein
MQDQSKNRPFRSGCQWYLQGVEILGLGILDALYSRQENGSHTSLQPYRELLFFRKNLIESVLHTDT